MVKQSGQIVLAESVQSTRAMLADKPKTYDLAKFWRQSVRQARATRHEGQAMVEFALSIPFLIILLMVLVELGFMLRTQTNITAAVREGVRVASAAGSTDPSKYPGYDADSLMVGTLNTVLQSNNDYKKLMPNNDSLVSSRPAAASSANLPFGVVVYRAKNWEGNGDDWSSTGWVPNATEKVWSTVICQVGSGCTRNTITGANNVPGPPSLAIYQHVFGYVDTSNNPTDSLANPPNGDDKLPTGKISVQTLYDQNKNCLVVVCGSNGGGLAGNNFVPISGDSNATRQAKFAHNPWYPAFRRSCDVPNNDADYTEAARQAGQNLIFRYFNSPAAPDWIGLRLNYRYQLQFLPNVLLALTGAPSGANGNYLLLGDRAVKMIEPPNTTILKQDCEQLGDKTVTPIILPPSRLTYRSFTREKP